MICENICYQQWVDMFNKKDKECYWLQLENAKLRNEIHQITEKYYQLEKKYRALEKEQKRITEVG